MYLFVEFSLHYINIMCIMLDVYINLHCAFSCFDYNIIVYIYGAVSIKTNIYTHVYLTLIRWMEQLHRDWTLHLIEHFFFQ